jgi:hypothetical protein
MLSDPFDYFIIAIALLIASIPLMVIIGALSDGIVSVIRALQKRDAAEDELLDDDNER